MEVISFCCRPGVCEGEIISTKLGFFAVSQSVLGLHDFTIVFRLCRNVACVWFPLDRNVIVESYDSSMF